MSVQQRNGAGGSIRMKIATATWIESKIMCKRGSGGGGNGSVGYRGRSRGQQREKMRMRRKDIG